MHFVFNIALATGKIDIDFILLCGCYLPFDPLLQFIGGEGSVLVSVVY